MYEGQPLKQPHEFDALSKEVLTDPYEFFTSLRCYAPVYQIPGTNWYSVSRYEDVKAITLNTEDFSSNLSSILLSGPNGETMNLERPEMDTGPVDVLALADPPAHNPQRRLGLKALSMRFVQSLEPMIREKANEIMDRFMARGHCDWVQEFAKEIPMTLSLMLAGFPADNWQEVKKWGDQAIALLSGVNTQQSFVDNALGAQALFDYTEKHYHAIKVTRGDNFTTALIEAAEDDAHVLSDREAISMIFQLLIAGADSSANTMGNAVRQLIHKPKIQQQLREQTSLVPAFIEEVLRLETPFMGHFRQTKRDVEIAGTTIPAQSRVMLMWASANRDEKVFKNPDVIDLQRNERQKHYSFGGGIHQCLGAHLARTEVRIALEELLRRTENIEADKSLSVPEHIHSVFIRELHHLPIRFTLK